MFAPVDVRESDAEVICEVSGLVSTVPSSVVGDVTVGLAGLASTGEESAVLQSLDATETAFGSIAGSVVTLGVKVAGMRGDEEGMMGGGSEEGTSVCSTFSSIGAGGSSVDAGSESLAVIVSGCHTSDETYKEQ